MLVYRSRPRRLAALSFLRTSSARSTSTTSTGSASSVTSEPADKPQSRDSIFTAPESPWDHVFSDIEPVSPSQRLRTRLGDHNTASSAPAPTSLSRRKKDKGHGADANQGLVQRSSGVRHQRASITAREMSVFDEMFDLIFNAVSAQEGKGTSSASSASRTSASSPFATPHAPSSSSAPSPSAQTPGIGRSGAQLNDIFRTLRRHTSRVRWTSAIDEELDRKKETMELFNTDYDLLAWVTKEVFGEAQQWEEEATRAMAASRGATGSDAAAATTTTTRQPKQGSGPGHGKHSIYPHLIAHAMRIFRTTYLNPSLSLAIFQHAARVSIPSYVFGCTAPAYNELIEAKWEGWGDLEGVCNALEEMRANGVKMDGRTRIVVEKVRREVGEARPVALGEAKPDTEGEEGRAEDVNPLARQVWEALGDVEVMRLVQRIERLALRDRSRKSTPSPHEESWKSGALQAGKDDGWRFDGWDKATRTGDTKKPRRKMSQDKRTLDGWTSPEEMAFR